MKMLANFIHYSWRRYLGVLFVFIAATALPAATSYTFTTLAGSAGASGATDGTGSAARFSAAYRVAVDAVGNVYVADTNNHAIRKVTSGGVVTTLAGLPGTSGSADGTGSAARFHYPKGIAVDGAGNVYVSDTNNFTIRKVTSAGVVTTLAGLVGSSGSSDGTGSAARFASPQGLGIDGSGNMYVADKDNQTIRKVTSGGVVTTLAGLAGSVGSTDGTGTAARFNFPAAVAVSSAGTIYVADTNNHLVRAITSGGVVSTLAGAAGTNGTADGVGSAARFNAPEGIAVDAGGNVYIADTAGNTLRLVSAGGTVTTIAGTPSQTGSGDGPGSIARFDHPNGVAVDAAGNVYVADTNNNTVRRGIVAPYTFTTLAGSVGAAGTADALGSAARFNAAYRIAVDAAGNVYVADTNNHAIRKMTSGGVVTTLAGLPGTSGSADGTGSAARFHYPKGIAVDGAGNVYVADTNNFTIRKVTSAGVVATIAGLAGTSGSADGTGSAARFASPQGLGIDGSGNLYVADKDNQTIRKVTSGGVVTTLAGLAGSVGSTDGTGTAARFNFPAAVTVSSAGTIYVADTNNHLVRAITSAGVVSTLAGAAGTSGTTDAVGNAARFNAPEGIALDAGGNIYVADTASNTLRLVSVGGTVTTIAGTPSETGSGDGPGSIARFNHPNGVAVDAAGNVYVADTNNSTVRRAIVAPYTFTTLGGSAGVAGTADGIGSAARFNAAYRIAVDAAGNVYVADTNNHAIRKVTSGGVVTTIAGLAGTSGSADGTGAAARFHYPKGIVVDGVGNVYVADTNNFTIRRVTTAGVVTTIAGLAGTSGSADGTGSAARFASPQGLGIDGSGNLYVADKDNQTIRKVTSGGVVTTFAGQAGSVGSTDGTGTAARFNFPAAVAVSSSGTIYVADTNNHVVRAITSGGVVSTLAGAAGTSGSTDGVASAARFNGPEGIALDAGSNIYVADTASNTLRLVSASGTVTTIAGTPSQSGNGDGPGSMARFDHPNGVSVDTGGNVYVADTSNNTVRWAAFALPSQNSSPTASATYGTNFSYSVSFSRALSGPYTASGLPSGLSIDSATGVIAGTPMDLAGTYAITLEATNGAGTGSGSLSLVLAPAAPAAPTNVAVGVGDGQLTITFTGSADNGGATLAGYTATATPVGGGTGVSATGSGSPLTITGLTNGVSYNVTVTARNSANLTSSSASAVAPSTPTPPPSVTATSTPRQVLDAGQTLSLSVTANHASSYQWTHNGLAIEGATAATYTVSSASFSDGGRYQVIIGNAHGTILSKVMLVRVNPPAGQVVVWGDWSPSWNGATGVVALAKNSAAALLADGTVLSDTPNRLPNIFRLISGSCALLLDGTVVTWDASTPIGLAAVVPGWSDVIDVTRNGEYALLADGTVIDRNGNPPAINGEANANLAKNIVSLDVNVQGDAYHGALLRSDGTINGWGGNLFGEGGTPNIQDAVALAVGGFYQNIALRQDGTVVQWGWNPQGEPVPESVSDVVAIAAGFYTNVVLKRDGTVVQWGGNHPQPPSELGPVLAIEAGLGRISALRVASEGTTVPQILNQPANVSVYDGNSAQIWVVTNASTAATYQWYEGPSGDTTQPVAGATAPALTIRPSTASAQFWVRITNAFGSVDSDAATISILPTVYTVQPQSTTASYGGSTLFDFDFELGAVYSQQAFGILCTKDGVDYTSRVTTSFRYFSQASINGVGSTAAGVRVEISQLALSDAGSYRFELTINGTRGYNTTTRSATLTVNRAVPVITWETPLAITYGTALSEAQLNASSDVPGTFVYSPAAGAVLTAGNLTLGVSFTPIDTTNYSTATGSTTLTVGKAAATVTLGSLDAIFDGSAHPVSITTNPAGLATIVTYDGNSSAPTAPGVYLVSATIDESNYTGSANATLTISGNFRSWAIDHFTVAELLDVAISGPNADPDGDGLSNLLEYALGLSPRSASSAQLTCAKTANGWKFEYDRPVERPDLVYSVEFSTTLSNWTETGVTHEKVATLDGWETWRASCADPGTPGVFFRLRVATLP